MSVPTPPAPAPLDRDLFCLQCGYNLRGLSGDPVRCPECAFRNPLGDAEIPAEIIRHKLRQMESAPAACVAAILLALLMQPVFWYLASGWWKGGSSPYTGLVLFVAGFVLPAVTWLQGMRRFRASCHAHPGWRGVMLRYQLCGTMLGGMILVVLVVPALLFWPAPGSIRVRQGGLHLLLVGMVFVVIVWLVRGVFYEFYRRMAADMHQMQRDVAVETAREEARRRKARA